MRFAFSVIVAGCAILFGSAEVVRAQNIHEVIGTADNKWKWKGKESPVGATVGKPDGRLEVKVKNGDIVVFKITGGRHGVLFEAGAVEQANGVWEVVGNGKLMPADKLGKAYDPKKAVTTEPAGAGQIVLTIRIKNLKKGANNGILFGCNPHSISDDGMDVEMLGVIVLADV